MSDYWQRHEAIARYAVYKHDIVPSEKVTTIETRLPWGQAATLRDRMNNERPSNSFGSPIYGVKLENGEQVRALLHADG